MGRSIVYCGDCGTCLREQDFHKGAAREIDQRPFCARCRPPAPPSAVSKTSSRASTGRVPRIGTTRRQPRRPASKGPVLAALVLLTALLAGIVGWAAGRGRPEPRAATADAKAAVVPPGGIAAGSD